MILTYDRVWPAATPSDQREENLRAAREGRRPRVFMQRKDMQMQRPNVPAMRGLGDASAGDVFAQILGAPPPSSSATRSVLRAAVPSFPAAQLSPARMPSSYGVLRSALTPSAPTTALPPMSIAPDAGFPQNAQLPPTSVSPVLVAPAAPWYSQPWGLAAIGAGGLALGAGVILLLRR